LLSRNGGHINPPLHHDYSELKKNHGATMAQRILRWRLSHFHELQRVAIDEGLLGDSQIRNVESLDVYLSEDEYTNAKKLLEIWRKDMPEEAKFTHALDGEEAMLVRRPLTIIAWFLIGSDTNVLLRI
jgi:hypothetical protein